MLFRSQGSEETPTHCFARVTKSLRTGRDADMLTTGTRARVDWWEHAETNDRYLMLLNVRKSMSSAEHLSDAEERTACER